MVAGRVARRDPVSPERASAAAFAQAARLVVPVQAASLPLFVAVALVLGRHAPADRLLWWCAAGAATSAMAGATWSVIRGDLPGDGPRRSTVMIVRCTAAWTGAAWGAIVAVPQASDGTGLVLFTGVAVAASAFGIVLTSARTDLYVAYQAPLLLVALTVQVSRGDVVPYVGLGIVYGALATVVHRLEHRRISGAIQHAQRNEQLVAGLAIEHRALVRANQSYSELNERLAHQATHDPLTGLLNRRGAIDALDRALAVDHRPVGLLYVDLDRFKQINDTLGHRGGDQFIEVIGDRLARSCEPGAPGRIGGDEFIVVLPDHDEGAALLAGRRLAAVLSQPIHAEGREVPSTVSIGVAVGPRHGSEANELMRHANAALHLAKHTGRNRVVLFDDVMHRRLAARLEDEQALRRAIEDGYVVPYFQPEIDATTGSVVGAELLARWLRRDGTVVAARDFMPVAAKAGLVDRISEHIIHQARPQIRRLTTLGLPAGFRFRINLAPAATELIWRESPIESVLHGLDPERVVVDVTEAMISDDVPAAAAKLAGLRALGVRVCLDDFARGVSSLALLRRLPLDEVRIDRLSIDSIGEHHHDRAVVRSVITLARELGLTVTADGVETGAQADVLIALGCVRHQGHAYSPAMPLADLERFIAAWMADNEPMLAPLQHTRPLEA